MKFIQYEDVPRWYHLYWGRKSQGLFICISRFFLENCKHRNYEPYFTDFCNSPRYLPLLDRCEPILGQAYFGINDSITLVEQDNHCMTYRIKIPSIVRKSNFACMRCEGTGKRQPEDLWNGEECNECQGEKTRRVSDYIQIDEVCASLAVFMRAIDTPLEIADPCMSQKQLFVLKSMAKADRNGHAVGGEVSPEFLRFLESFSTTYEKQVSLLSVKEVIKKVHSLIYGKVNEHDRFSCLTRAGQFILYCPGNACQLFSESERKAGSKRGDSMNCHNLDTAMQQLMLLSGMAELSSLYDDWAAGKS